MRRKAPWKTSSTADFAKLGTKAETLDYSIGRLIIAYFSMEHGESLTLLTFQCCCLRECFAAAATFLDHVFLELHLEKVLPLAD
jgi:hypothetical protein